MRAAALLLAALALGLAVFGAWGLHSEGGQRAFDEMAGMIPFFASLVGAALAIGAAVLWWLGGRSGTAS